MVLWYQEYGSFGILPFKLTELGQKPILVGKKVMVFWDAMYSIVYSGSIAQGGGSPALLP